MAGAVDRRAVLIGMGACGASACNAAPAPVPAFRFLDLDLGELEKRHGGRIGVSATSRSAGASASWRGQERFTYCSTFKLFLAAAALDRDHRTADSVTRFVPVAAGDIVFHSPVAERFVGKEMMISQLCAATVEVSDNAAANILIREMGGLDAWREWYRSIGDQVTRVDRLETALNRVEGDLDTTTPLQAASNIGKLLAWEEPILIPRARQTLERWLTNSPTGPNRIKAAGPAGWSVAHKTGTSDGGMTNDIALLRGPDGEIVTMAVYYAAPRSSTPAQRDAVVADAARAALKALGHD